MKLLFVTASLFGEGSKSREVAAEFIAAWQAAHPGTRVAERTLDAATIPHLSAATVTGFMTPSEQHTPAQRAAVALSDTLTAEVEAADVLVIAAPMYNFSIPSTLKAWIDHITRAGRTFRYTAAGSEGLLKGKRVFVATARGGLYAGNGPQRTMDFQEPYLRAMLGFLGLTDVTFIHREGLAIGPEAAAAGLARARKAIGEIVAPRAAA